MAGGQLPEAVLERPMGGGRHMDGQIEAPRQNTDTANVIRMLVGHENRGQMAGIEVLLAEPPFDFAA